MKENISYLMSQIIIDYPRIELEKTLYTIDEVVTKGKNKTQIEMALNRLNENEGTQTIILNDFERLYFNKDKIIYMPKPDVPSKAMYFDIIIKNYNKAKLLLKEIKK